MGRVKERSTVGMGIVEVDGEVNKRCKVRGMKMRKGQEEIIGKREREREKEWERERG